MCFGIIKQLVILLWSKVLLFILLGLVISFSEVFIISNIHNILDYLNTFFVDKIVSQLIIIILYSTVVILSLILAYSSRYFAFSSSFEICMRIVLKINTKSFISNQSLLTNLITIERERLAREVLAPLFNIFSKISLPLLAFIYVIENNIFSFYVIILPILILLVIFIISSHSFSFFANKLENVICLMSLKINEFIRLFDARTRYENINYSNLYKINKNLSFIEASIDVVSQLPRQVIDIIIMSSVLYSATSDAEHDFFSVVITAPLLIRGISFAQSIYKSFASLRSNISALSVTKMLKPAISEHNVLNIENVLSFSYDSRRNILFNSKSTKSFLSVALRFPSGYGKTNAVLNFLYNENLLPTKIKLEINNIDSKLIGFIPADPYFEERTHDFVPYFDRYPHDFVPKVSSPCKASAGELFRNSFINEIDRGARLIIIDESIVSIPHNQRIDLFNICSNIEPMVCLIIITHSQDVIDLCDHLME